MEPSIAARNKKPDLPGGCARGARSFVNAAGCGQDHTRRWRALTRSRSPMMSSRRERYFASVKSMAYSSDGARAAKVAARTHRHRPLAVLFYFSTERRSVSTLSVLA